VKLDDLPPPGKLWNVTPPKTGDSSAEAVYRAVGMFLTRWEGLEQTFAFLFQRFVEGSNAAKRAYGTIMSNRGRIDALRAAAESYLVMHTETRDDLKDRLDRLIEHFRHAASRRNDVAHGVVHSVTVDDVGQGYFLLPPEYNSGKRDLFPDRKKAAIDKLSIFGKYRYTSLEILELMDRVTRYGDAVHEYASHGYEEDIRRRMSMVVGPIVNLAPPRKTDR